MLSDNYRISKADLEHALRRQKINLQQGDVVLIRTGRMQVYVDSARYTANAPGLGLDAVRFLSRRAAR